MDRWFLVAWPTRSTFAGRSPPPPPVLCGLLVVHRAWSMLPLWISWTLFRSLFPAPSTMEMSLKEIVADFQTGSKKFPHMISVYREEVDLGACTGVGLEV